jgi:hypothetical protein
VLARSRQIFLPFDDDRFSLAVCSSLRSALAACDVRDDPLGTERDGRNKLLRSAVAGKGGCQVLQEAFFLRLLGVRPPEIVIEALSVGGLKNMRCPTHARPSLASLGRLRRGTQVAPVNAGPAHLLVPRTYTPPAFSPRLREGRDRNAVLVEVGPSHYIMASN